MFFKGQLCPFKKGPDCVIPLPLQCLIHKKLVEGDAGGADATGREDLKVTVLAAEGHKCERCWIYSDEVGTDTEHPTLCKRCASAVK